MLSSTGAAPWVAVALLVVVALWEIAAVAAPQLAAAPLVGAVHSSGDSSDWLGDAALYSCCSSYGGVLLM